MKNFFNTMLENFFGLLSGTIGFAILLMILQIAGNFGTTINEKTISMGWLMVFLWIGIIFGMTLFQNKNSQKEE